MTPKKKLREMKHQHMICFKVSDIELEALNRAAATAGISRSELLRQLFLNSPIEVRCEIVADMKDLRKLVGEYGKIGSNLNQIAKYFNSGGARSQAMEDEIRQCITELFALRKEVLRMAGEFHGSRQAH